MSAKKIPITPVFLDQEWAESRPVSNLPPPPNTGASKRKEAA